jgi:hypothetical protein
MGHQIERQRERERGPPEGLLDYTAAAGRRRRRGKLEGGFYDASGSGSEYSDSDAGSGSDSPAATTAGRDSGRGEPYSALSLPFDAAGQTLMLTHQGRRCGRPRHPLCPPSGTTARCV